MALLTSRCHRCQGQIEANLFSPNSFPPMGVQDAALGVLKGDLGGGIFDRNNEEISTGIDSSNDPSAL